MSDLAERYARALGVWLGPKKDVVPNAPIGGWLMCALSAGGWRPDGGYRVAYGTGEGRPLTRDIDEPTALLWLHTLASGESFDVGLCGACVERGGGWTDKLTSSLWPGHEARDRARIIQLHGEVGRSLRGETVEDNEATTLTFMRPCPTCTTDGKPTGRDVRTLARLMVEAMPVERRGVLLNRVEWVDPGNPEARLHLATAADQLQLRGNPLGTWLALWLEGECKTCAGSGEQHEEARGWRPGPREKDFQRTRRCDRCGATGQVLGTEQGAMETASRVAEARRHVRGAWVVAELRGSVQP